MSDQEPPEWLTEMDREILEALKSELTLSPTIISENIDRSRSGVTQRLNALQAGDFVEKVGRGRYKITNKGFFLVAEPVAEDYTKEAIEDAKRERKSEEN